MVNRINRETEKILNDLEEIADKDIVEPVVEKVFNQIVDQSPIASGDLQRGWDSNKVSVNKYTITNPISYVQYVINGTLGRAPNSWVQAALRRYNLRRS